MIRTRAVAVLALPLAFAVACGSNGSTGSAQPGTVPAASSAAPSPAAAALNPVDLLRKAGAIPPPGASVGTAAGAGWKSASGSFPNGSLEQITVKTFADGGASDPSFGAKSDDSTWYIKGPGFVVELIGVANLQTGGTEFDVPPEVVAARVGGTVVPRG